MTFLGTIWYLIKIIGSLIILVFLFTVLVEMIKELIKTKDN